MEHREEKIARIALTMFSHVGLRRARQLLLHFGSALDFFHASEEEWLAIPNISESYITDWKTEQEQVWKAAGKEMLFIEQHDIRTYCFLDADYPSRLRNCPDAPCLLYSKGNINLESAHILSVVGTRQPTDRGKEICQKIITDLAAYVPDLTIVSGLAYGIDITAHKAALEAGIPTIIIPGHGLDRIYPALHRQIAIQALQTGGILTEYPSGTTPEKQNFVARNRIIAGLSDATLVIESKAKGGSLITADMANSYNREVFTVPGRVDDTNSAGCNNLIKRNQALLVDSAADIIQAMQWESTQAETETESLTLFEDLSPQEEQIMQILRQEPDGVHVNIVVIETGLPYPEVTSALFTLEMAGMVRALPGSIYRATLR